MVFTILAWLIGLYIYLLLGRFFLDLVVSVNPKLRPKGLWLVLFEIVFTMTDGPLKLMRKLIKPIRLGAVQLDLGWTVLFIALTSLQSLLIRLS